MARQRVIHPSFWTNEKVASCSLLARLLMLGITNFADDAGRKKLSPFTIKMEVFPADPFTISEIESAIDELITVELLLKYSVKGVEYICFPGWTEHQKVKYPTFKFPGEDGVVSNPFLEDSGNESSSGRSISLQEKRREL